MSDDIAFTEPVTKSVSQSIVPFPQLDHALVKSLVWKWLLRLRITLPATVPPTIIVKVMK